MEGSNPEVKQNPSPNAFPFALSEGEKIKFSENEVSFFIKNDDDESLKFAHGSFVLTNQKVMWFSLEQNKAIFFHYPNAISHGYNKLTLVCLINFENYDEEEAYNGVFGNPEEKPEEAEEEKILDSVLDKIKTSNKLDNEEDFVQIIGSYQVEFEFDSKNRLNVQDVFQIFSECSALNPDKDQSNPSNLFGLLGINPEEMDEENEGEENGEMIEEENGGNEANGEDDVFE